MNVHEAGGDMCAVAAYSIPSVDHDGSVIVRSSVRPFALWLWVTSAKLRCPHAADYVAGVIIDVRTLHSWSEGKP